ncbi:hypothetical protein F3K02_26085 [Hydrogenophaga sp. D2P1]|uniref:Uncharacterized protein n=1 Tax=Hydrogenophaga aromaticivorans TaxID=2610898 RepID=A0A7Y8L0Y3_9BURK|nr:hypothetical protein [Hydrogenophaga aromaticivorans]
MTPRAACGVTPQGAALAARQSRFRGALGLTSPPARSDFPQDAVEPALPGHSHRPLGGDAEGGAGGCLEMFRESSNDCHNENPHSACLDDFGAHP